MAKKPLSFKKFVQTDHPSAEKEDELTQYRSNRRKKTALETNAEPSTDEALDMSQRMARSRLMKRLKSRIAMGRKRAARKMASKDKLEKRAMRQARDAV